MKRPTTALKRSALDRYRVPILDRTLDLLELLTSQPQALTLTELTEALKMPKNSIFRIATTLTLRGYAERDEDTKAYRASRKLLSLGHAAVGGQRLVEAAAPVLSSLRDASGETALLGTLAGNHGVVLDQVPSPLPVKVVVEIGHSFPLHTAAPAKAILAHLGPDKQREFIKQISRSCTGRLGDGVANDFVNVNRNLNHRLRLGLFDYRLELSTVKSLRGLGSDDTQRREQCRIHSIRLTHPHGNRVGGG
jgi:DNA-binding IclR family transcriptional regulator